MRDNPERGDAVDDRRRYKKNFLPLYPAYMKGQTKVVTWLQSSNCSQPVRRRRASSSKET